MKFQNQKIDFTKLSTISRRFSIFTEGTSQMWINTLKRCVRWLNKIEILS